MSLLPSDWSYRKIRENIDGSTTWQMKTAKKIQNDIISDSSKTKEKIGPKFLDTSTKVKVVSFYESEENSKQLPGKKDFKSVIQEDGKRRHVQKKISFNESFGIVRKLQGEISTRQNWLFEIRFTATTTLRFGR